MLTIPSSEIAAGAAQRQSDAFGADVKPTPFWWEDVDPPLAAGDAMPPAAADVVVVGSGYTGLNAALVTARAGRSTFIVDAEQLGWGCSTRNGGHISTSVKPDLETLTRRHGAERARAIRNEGDAALDWIEAFLAAENIDCDFSRCGRFHGAHSAQAYEQLARRAKGPEECHAVPRAEQRCEIGSDFYHGGLVFPRYAALHPAKYHAGLVARARQAGVTAIPHCPVLGIEREGGRFRVTTPKGTVSARDVVVATNGYSGSLVPWLKRRIIPIGSYIIATEPLPAGTVERLFPTGRLVSDSRRTVYYYRASPDRRRVLFGGRVSAAETETRLSGPRLQRDMTAIFPELANVAVTHSWMGTVAYSFDSLAHCGTHEGIHYAMSYCGSGVSMAGYLGMRTGQRLLGLPEGQTGFDGLTFPTRPFYSGRPWFLPAMVAWCRWRDTIEVERGRGK